MSVRSLALAIAGLVVLATGSALAAPVTVQLRVEGSAKTLFEGPVTTDGHTVDKGDGPHPCDGTTRTTPPLPSGPGPTVTSALDDASRQAGFTWTGKWFPSFGDFLISQIGSDAPASGSSDYWGTVRNYQPTSVGGCQEQVMAGDDVLFALGDVFSQPLLRLQGPSHARTGAPTQVKVTDGKTNASVAGAVVAGVLSGSDGVATLTFPTAGLVRLKTEKPGTIRSNGLSLCVSDTGTGDCGVPPSLLGAPSATGTVKDTVAPRARIGVPRDGVHYRVGPRVLSGSATDNVGVTEVKLALRRYAHGQRGRWWSGRRERFVGRGCAKTFFFHIDAARNWSYLLPRKLPPGRYVLDVKAFDRARNRDEHFVRGSNRVVFYVGRAYEARPTASSAFTAARVKVLLARRSSSVFASVRARAALVRAGGRKCKVGASTPLAALAAFLHKHKTRYLVRDYGNCSPTNAAGASQLFVRAIANESNKGNDGWFYKVNDLAPEVGAGDPASRLHKGDNVLWFYCVFDQLARSCQRSLRVVPASSSAPGTLRVTLRAYDNAGRWVPVAGATVTSGAAQAPTGADGAATLAVSSGRHVVTARKNGMIDAFPITVNVR